MQEDFGEELLNSGFAPFNIEELTKESILEEDTFKYVFAMEGGLARTKVLVKLQEKAKELKVAKSFDKLFKAYQQDYVSRKKQEGSEVIKFTNSPIDNLKCGKWQCDDFGVSKTVLNNFEAQKITACSHPIIPIERLVNVDRDTEKVKIAFYKDNKWQSVTVDRSVVANKGNIIQLADRGIEVNSDNAKDLVSFLADIISLNAKEIPVNRSVDRLGWTDKEFSPYASDLKYDGDQDYKDAFDAVKARGSYEEWKAYCKALRKNKIVKILMSASFASPLNKLLSISPYIVHLWGGTGTAKTVAVMVAMSIWGNPELGKLTRTLNSTQVALGRYAGFVHDIPFAGDELQIIKDRWDSFDNLVMFLTEGVDRARGKAYGGLEQINKWNNSFIFTGEQPITQSNSGGGVKNRVFEVEVTGKLIEDGNAVVNFLKENHGFAGKEFIENLPSDKELQERHREIFREILNSNETTDKQASIASAILLASEVSAYIFEDEPLKIEDIKEYFINSQEVSVANRSYELIRNWIGTNINRFKEDSIGEIWGKYTQENNCCYVDRTVLEKMLRENGIDFNAIKKELAQNGIIERDKEGKYTQKFRVGSVNRRFVKIVLKEEAEDIKTDFPF